VLVVQEEQAEVVQEDQLQEQIQELLEQRILEVAVALVPIVIQAELEEKE
jgi:hypothetical protein